MCFIPCLLIFKTDTSSKVLLKDQAKFERVILHNMIGEHLCHCFPPMIATNPGFAISNITSTSASFRWVCDVAASYQVNYGTSNSKGTKFPATKPSTTYKDYTVTVTGLKPKTLYHAGPYSQAQGRSDFKSHLMSTGPDDFTFTTLAEDAAALSISGKVLDSKGTGVTGVKVTISGDSAGSVTTAADGKYEFANLKGKNYTVTPTKASYTFTPANKAFTALAANATQDFVAATTGVKGGALPFIIYDVTHKFTSNEATITWKTNIPSTSQVEYGTSKTYGLKSGENTEMSTDHYIQLFNLTPGASYFFRAVSKAGVGSAPVYSADFTINTEAVEKRIADKNNYFVDPNPCSDKTEFNYYLFQPVNNLTIDIFSLSGRKMAVLEAPRSALNTGWNRISWNVKDNAGKAMVNGLYVYKMKFVKGNTEEIFKSAQLSVRR
jgi:flagellar hook assembly protein FlgD